VFFRRKRNLEVDLGGLREKGESLSSFLKSILSVDANLSGNKLSVDSENLTPEDLKRSVNKFVYRENLNNTYWVSLENGVIKINRFKNAKKQEERKKKSTPPSTIRHGW
jgi:hypothetical protein